MEHNKYMKNKKEKNAFTYNDLRTIMLKDLPEGPARFAIDGLIKCYEKQGLTADNALKELTKAIN